MSTTMASAPLPLPPAQALRPVVLSHGLALSAAIETIDDVGDEDVAADLADFYAGFTAWAATDDTAHVHAWDERIDSIAAMLTSIGAAFPLLFTRAQRAQWAFLAHYRRKSDPSWTPAEGQCLPDPDPVVPAGRRAIARTSAPHADSGAEQSTTTVGEKQPTTAASATAPAPTPTAQLGRDGFSPERPARRRRTAR